MAKKTEKVFVPKYPSQFGSHASMIDIEATEALNDPKLVVLVDEHGPYTTGKDRLDDGLADPKRYSENRIINLKPVKVESKS